MQVVYDEGTSVFLTWGLPTIVDSGFDEATSFFIYVNSTLIDSFTCCGAVITDLMPGTKYLIQV